MHAEFRPIADTLKQFRAAGLPLGGALRLASVHATLDAPSATLPHFAAACAALGHAPSWAELRALLRAGQHLEPRLVKAGARLTRAGAPADGIWIVHHGALVARPSGREGGPMAVFGPAEGYDRGVWIDSLYATRGGVILHLPRAEAELLVRDCPIAATGLGIGACQENADATTAPPAS